MFGLDIEARLAVGQDERRALLERSLASDSNNEKLLADNRQLTKKVTELETALQEVAREYQALQVNQIEDHSIEIFLLSFRFKRINSVNVDGSMMKMLMLA